MDLRVAIEGIGLWAPGVPDWPAAAALLRGGSEFSIASRPAPTMLPPAERRRAPETVLLAVQAAAEACAAAQCDPASLPCVFASSQGDLAVTDAMCTTLATAPLELSPTKFHNSVHNAAAGYWTIAAECRRPSTALSAARDSVGAGLLEAVVQSTEAGESVLLVCYDSAASSGALAEVAPHAASFAVAFVLGLPRAGMPTLRVTAAQADTPIDTLHHSRFTARVTSNPSAAALPLLDRLANRLTGRVCIAAGPAFRLALEVTP